VEKNSQVELRVEYDDGADDIIENVNDVLREHGLKFVCDEKEHDGFNLYALVKIVKEKS
jgi:hypothetical protein